MKLTDLKREIGIVDKNVDSGKFLPSGLHHRFDLVSFRHIRLKDHSAPAGGFHVFENFQGAFPVLQIVNDDGGAGLRETLRRSRTDTAARPGNENRLSLERLEFFWLRHYLLVKR